MVAIEYALFEQRSGRLVEVSAESDHIAETGSNAFYKASETTNKLRCAVKDCDAGLRYVPQATISGTFTRAAHFARLDDQQHNKAVCDFPNKDDEPSSQKKTKEQNSLIEFFSQRVKGAPILYVNADPALRDFSRALDARKAYFHYSGTHMTPRQQGDVKHAVKTLEQIYKMGRQRDFGDEFWNKVPVLGQGYFVKFNDWFLGRDYRSLLMQSFAHARRGTHQPLVAELRTGAIPSDMQKIFNPHKKIYELPCAAQTVTGAHGQPYDVQIVLASGTPYRLGRLEENARYAVWTAGAAIDPKDRFNMASLVCGQGAGAVRIILPVTKVTQILKLDGVQNTFDMGLAGEADAPAPHSPKQGVLFQM